MPEYKAIKNAIQTFVRNNYIVMPYGAGLKAIGQDIEIVCRSAADLVTAANNL